MSQFGKLLREFRQHGTDPDNFGRRLSQEKLGALLGLELDISGFSGAAVSDWERGMSKIHADDRLVLVSLLKVLYQCECINTLAEANHLLEAGNYRSLGDDDIKKINPKWQSSFIGRDKPTTVDETSALTETLNSEAQNLETNSNLSGFGSGNNLLPAPLLNALISFISKMPDGALDGSPGILLDKLFSEKFSRRPVDKIELYSSQSGNTPINLAQQRLLVSTSFGAYFTGLLEQPNLYLDIESQIDCPALSGQEGLQPLQRIFWLLAYPNGPRTVIVSGEGGMGKSTLSAKIIRCLYQEQAVDMILGDSAKSEHINPVTKEKLVYKAGYYDPISFYEKLCNQLGLPTLPKGQMIDAIKDRLIGRKAVVVVDNLETVWKDDEILDSLKEITSRDVRAIVTTRQLKGIRTLSNKMFVIQMKPLVDPIFVKEFLSWHIKQYQHQHPALQRLKNEIYENEKVEWLIERTGGIPLLMQFVLSDVAKYSWEFMQTIPSLFGKELLDFLYELRWNDLGNNGIQGEVAKQLVIWIAQEQYQGQSITSIEISKWANKNEAGIHLQAALSLLYERFLIINRDVNKGNFSIYPSLAEFVSKL